jgi:orotate phosphoribosyltransferase-like protein
MDVVYISNDITKIVTQWKSIGTSTVKLAVLSKLLGDHIKKNMMVVNVNGGLHFTHLGLVSFISICTLSLSCYAECLKF